MPIKSEKSDDLFKKKKWNLVLISLEIAVILTFALTHITPTIALRTHLFTTGYFSEAFTCEIKEQESLSDFETLYKVSPALSQMPGGTPFIETYKVNAAFGVFYWGDYYGEV